MRPSRDAFEAWDSVMLRAVFVLLLGLAACAQQPPAPPVMAAVPPPAPLPPPPAPVVTPPPVVVRTPAPPPKVIVKEVVKERVVAIEKPIPAPAPPAPMVAPVPSAIPPPKAVAAVEQAPAPDETVPREFKRPQSSTPPFVEDPTLEPERPSTPSAAPKPERHSPPPTVKVSSNTQSVCHGHGEVPCKRLAGCTWAAGYVKANGTRVAPYCRIKSVAK